MIISVPDSWQRAQISINKLDCCTCNVVTKKMKSNVSITELDDCLEQLSSIFGVVYFYNAGFYDRIA